MSLTALMRGPLPVTAPLVLNPLMAKMVEAAGLPAGYLGGGATGYQKVVLEANLNVTEMCQVAVDIRAVSPLPLVRDGACGYGDPMHMHRTIGMSEAAGFAAIEIEDQLVPKRAHHHAGIEHMIPMELMKRGRGSKWHPAQGGHAGLGAEAVVPDEPGGAADGPHRHASPVRRRSRVARSVTAPWRLRALPRHATVPSGSVSVRAYPALCRLRNRGPEESGPRLLRRADGVITSPPGAPRSR